VPRLSVIIPTYQRPQYLPRAIASVLAQSFKDFELIVVDDASKDGTARIVETFHDDRIRYLCHSKKKGGSAARNSGIRSSRGQYLAFLDDDDEWLPGKLQKQIDVLSKSSLKVQCIYTAYNKVDAATGKVLGIHRPCKEGDLAIELLRWNWIGSTSTVLLKRECLERVGLFDEALPSVQDYDLWIRLSKKIHFGFVKDPLVNHFVYKDRITMNPDALLRGTEILKSKLGHSSKALKENFSFRYCRVGVLYCLNGDLIRGRDALLKAIKLRPFKVKPYLMLCLSVLGSKNFRKVQSFRMKWYR